MNAFRSIAIATLCTTTLALSAVAAMPVAGSSVATAVTDAQMGRIGGPGRITTIVGAYDTDAYRITFSGGNTARITLIGDGDTDLDLFVYDSAGNRVASDIGPTDTAVITFTPRATATYTVRVINLGRVYNRYTLTTN